MVLASAVPEDWSLVPSPKSQVFVKEKPFVYLRFGYARGWEERLRWYYETRDKGLMTYTIWNIALPDAAKRPRPDCSNRSPSQMPSSSSPADNLRAPGKFSPAKYGHRS